MDVHTPEQRSRNMRAIKSKNTKMEVRLAKALWARGHRYRKHNKRVYGKPDLTFKKYKLAIFIDSDFFHGKNWEIKKFRIKTNREFWWPKIERNIRRDELVNKNLDDQGWTVIRFWSTEIKTELEYCIAVIEEKLANQKLLLQKK